MNSNISKRQVVLTILFIFSITFFLFVYLSYQDKKDEIKFVQKNIQIRMNNLYMEISDSMLKKQLKSRTKYMLERHQRIQKIEAFRNQDREQLEKLFLVHFKTLQEQIRGFNIMHFYDKNGKSILRMHQPDKFGDDLTKIRTCVKSLVKEPRNCSFFEVGLEGLAYRHTTAVYDNGELLGFFEIGMKPSLLLKKIEKIFDLKGYFFIKQNVIPKEIRNNRSLLQSNTYTICQFCSEKDKFIVENASKIDVDTVDDFKYKGSIYSVISQEIFDAQSKSLGKIVFFHDITLFQNQIDNLLLKSIILFLISALIAYFVLSRYIEDMFKKLDKARFLLDNTNDALYVVSLENGAIMDINERASLMLGYTKNELINKKVTDIRKPMNNDKPLDWNSHVNSLKLKHFITSRGMHLRKDGTTFPVEANLSYIRDEDQEYMIAVARDITLQLDIETKIKQKANELQRLQDMISKSVLYTTSDLDGKIRSVSKAFENLSGYKESELIGKNHSMFKNPNTSKQFYDDMWETLEEGKQFVGEIQNYTKGKKPYWIKITIDPILDEEGVKVGYSSYRENITDKKELEYISTHDTLTDIYNRGYFQSELSKKLKAASRYEQNFGFMMLDIDHFKKINDTFGHKVGDDVLISLSRAIKEHIREDDIFARWGGEEFVIIANGVDIEHLKQLAQKLREKLAKTSFSPAPNVTVSFGLTVYKSGDNCESIQKRADDALYVAKENGRDKFEVL